MLPWAAELRDRRRNLCRRVVKGVKDGDRGTHLHAEDA